MKKGISNAQNLLEKMLPIATQKLPSRDGKKMKRILVLIFIPLLACLFCGRDQTGRIITERRKWNKSFLILLLAVWSLFIFPSLPLDCVSGKPSYTWCVPFLPINDGSQERKKKGNNGRIWQRKERNFSDWKDTWRKENGKRWKIRHRDGLRRQRGKIQDKYHKMQWKKQSPTTAIRHERTERRDDATKIK